MNKFEGLYIFFRESHVLLSLSDDPDPDFFLSDYFMTLAFI